jgi:hypothetical protein
MIKIALLFLFPLVRVFALPNKNKDKLKEPRVLERMLQNAISAKLERGGMGNIELQLSNATR